METIGKRLQELRKDKNLTQAEFGKLFGVTHAHISSIERGKENASEMFILFISEKLHVNEKWLKTGEGEKYIASNFDTRTDEGNIVKFKKLDESLVEYVKTQEGDKLRRIVQILSRCLSLVENDDFNTEEKRIEYLENLEKIFKILDVTFANANGLTIMKDRKEDYKALLKFSTKANNEMLAVTNSIRNILNLYIDKYASDEKIGFRIF